MKKIIKRYSKLYTLLKRIKKYLRILYNKKAFGTYMWNLRKGDDKLSLDYPLKNDSIFFDVGGYTGEFTEKIINNLETQGYHEGLMLNEKLTKRFSELCKKSKIITV